MTGTCSMRHGLWRPTRRTLEGAGPIPIGFQCAQSPVRVVSERFPRGRRGVFYEYAVVASAALLGVTPPLFSPPQLLPVSLLSFACAARDAADSQESRRTVAPQRYHELLGRARERTHAVCSRSLRARFALPCGQRPPRHRMPAYAWRGPSRQLCQRASWNACLESEISAWYRSDARRLSARSGSPPRRWPQRRRFHGGSASTGSVKTSASLGRNAGPMARATGLQAPSKVGNPSNTRVENVSKCCYWPAAFGGRQCLAKFHATCSHYSHGGRLKWRRHGPKVLRQCSLPRRPHDRRSEISLMLFEHHSLEHVRYMSTADRQIFGQAWPILERHRAVLVNIRASLA